MFLDTFLISCKYKNKSRTSKSSTKAEYRVMSTASSEIVWLQRLLSDPGVVIKSPTLLHVNNTSAIKIVTDLVEHENKKHIEVGYHYIQELVIDR